MKTILRLLVLLAFATPGYAKNFLSQEEALKLAFPGASEVKRESIFLSAEEVAQVRQLSGVDVDGELYVRYVGRKGTDTLGFVYFDGHRVRTLPETIMVLVTPDGKISSIEILSFNEPQEYLPKERWLDQLEGRKLDDELALTRAIRPITGATLSGRAIVNAARKMLAIHEAVAARDAK